MGAKESLEGGKEGERQTVYVFSLSFLVLQLYFLTFFNFFHLLFFFENLRFKIYFLEERAGKVKKNQKKIFFTWRREVTGRWRSFHKFWANLTAKTALRITANISPV